MTYEERCALASDGENGQRGRHSFQIQTTLEWRGRERVDGELYPLSLAGHPLFCDAITGGRDFQVRPIDVQQIEQDIEGEEDGEDAQDGKEI